jgi:hypothetical protein
MNILLGTDPELFVKQNGEYVSAFNLIPGTKKQPHPVRNGAVQVDGMALEFNTAPADTPETFIFNIQSVLAQLKDMVDGYELALDAVAEFGEEYISSQPREATDLGCDPDSNAWTGRVNDSPAVDAPFRTAAGHVHVGFCEDADVESPMHRASCEALIRQLDFYLGLPSVLLDPNAKRRELYGKAGAYRAKTYGCEYRVLSNFWLKDERLMEWVFTATNKAVESLMGGRFLSQEFGDIQDIINTSDVDRAKALINEIGLEVPNV